MAAPAPSAAPAAASSPPSSDIREMLFSSLTANHKIMIKELPEFQRRAAKYQASLQKAHEDGLALHQTLCSLAEANTSSELNRSWTFLAEEIKQHEALRQDLLKVIGESFVTPMGKSADADEWSRLEKEIRRESERYDSDVSKATANMTKLGKGGSSEALAKAVGDLNAKVKEHEVKRSEMMTDAEDFGFKRQILWMHAFCTFLRAHQGFVIAATQRAQNTSASLIQCEKLEHHPSHQHQPYQWRGGAPSSGETPPSSPKSSRSSVMVQLSSLGHSISSKIRPGVGRKPEDKKKDKEKDDKEKERSKTESSGSTPQLVSSPSGGQIAPLQPLSHVRALFDYQAGDEDELTFKPGDIIAVIAMDDKDWWEGELNGQIGFFPSNYVEQSSSPRQRPTISAPRPPEPSQPGITSPRAPAPADAPLQATVPLSVVSPRPDPPKENNALHISASAPVHSKLQPAPVPAPKSGSGSNIASGSASPAAAAGTGSPSGSVHVPRPPKEERKGGSRIRTDSSAGAAGSSGSALAASASAPAPRAAQAPNANAAPVATAPVASATSPAVSSPPSSPPTATAAVSVLPSPRFLEQPPPPPQTSESPSHSLTATSPVALSNKIGGTAGFKIVRQPNGSGIRPAPDAPPPAVTKVQVNGSGVVKPVATATPAPPISHASADKNRPPSNVPDTVLQKLAVELQETETVILALLPKQPPNNAAATSGSATAAKSAQPVAAAAPVVVVPAPGAAVSAFNPEEWEACTDDNGDTFYYNVKTNQSVWEIPGFQAV